MKKAQRLLLFPVKRGIINIVEPRGGWQDDGEKGFVRRRDV